MVTETSGPVVVSCMNGASVERLVPSMNSPFAPGWLEPTQPGHSGQSPQAASGRRAVAPGWQGQGPRQRGARWLVSGDLTLSGGNLYDRVENKRRYQNKCGLGICIVVVG